jgi:hypothetical protein
MVFLRSEEHLGRWLDANRWEPGKTVPAQQMNDLARAWWWSRLDPGWRPRPLEESQALLESVGLSGPFWELRPRT